MTLVLGRVLGSALLTATIVGFYPTNASALNCNFFFASGPAVCGDSNVTGGSRFFGNVTASPNPVMTEQSGGPVAVGATGVGPGGISGATTAAGSFGEAHVAASANSGTYNVPTGLNGDQANVLAQGIIGFIDGFSITGAAVNVRVTTSVDGVFTGQVKDTAGNALPSPGFALTTFQLDDTSNLQELINNHGQINQSFSSSRDVLLQPGDYLFLWALETRAAAVVDNFSITPAQTADASNTGHLFFDVLTPGGSLTFLSGHDYSSAAASATPLPASLPLFATGLGALGLLGWRRKRKGAGVAA